ncbi:MULTISPECIES: hypothetical protein [unclassified Paenibacillus]|uniref:hypothetical protein n=1 Tax=unclassified Paenibacillus TaxID=185978 RepID=UPI00362F91AF
MATVRVYYDYFNDTLSPIWLLLHFGRGGIDWTKEQLYMPIQAPFHRIESEEIHEDTMSLSILLEDLTINPYEAGYYGIRLDRVLQRIYKQQLPVDPYDIEQFVIQLGDLEEVLQMNVRQHY